jgi:hypothetical protein
VRAPVTGARPAIVGNLSASAQVEPPRSTGTETRIMDKSTAQRQPERQVLAHIEELVGEEHRLREQPALSDAEHERLGRLEVELDQCWDLLRQRRALRETGGDPERAHVRPPDVVEKYIG